MPSYTYLCLHEPSHGEFEVWQSIKAPHPEECPKCKEENIKSPPPKRLIALSSFILVGNGWAKDQYK